MARRNRVPEYDLQKHLVTGKRVPQSGTGISRDVDDDSIDRDDPMEFTAGPGTIDQRSAGSILASYLADAEGLDSAAGDSGQPLDLKAVSDASNNEMSETRYGVFPGNKR